MRAFLRIRVGPFSFRRALGLSLLLHAIALSLPRPAHRHELAYTGPLLVQVPPAAIALPRPPAMVAPEPEARVPPRPAPKPRAPKPQRLPAPDAGTSPGRGAPEAAERQEQPSAAPAPPTAPLPSGPVAPPANAEARALSRVSPPEFAAAYLNNPKPPFPRAAQRAGEAGTVILKVLVTREGLAARVEVETSSGSDALDRSARTTVERWRFTPARRGDEAVEGWVRVPIAFRLEER